MDNVLKDHRWPSSTRLSFCSANLRNTSPKCCLSSLYSVFLRHFGINTTWYLHSHLVWLRLSISSIANSLSCALAAHAWESPRWTPGFVKLLLPPRQSRGVSLRTSRPSLGCPYKIAHFLEKAGSVRIGPADTVSNFYARQSGALANDEFNRSRNRKGEQVTLNHCTFQLPTPTASAFCGTRRWHRTIPGPRNSKARWRLHPHPSDPGQAD